jgi:hypothetical protein
MLGELEAFAQEGQQLFGRVESQLPPCVDLLYPAVEKALRRLRVGPELKNERPSHHNVKLRRMSRWSVKTSLNLP